MGLDTGGITDPPPARTHRQSDDLNEAWVERYLSEQTERTERTEQFE